MNNKILEKLRKLVNLRNGAEEINSKEEAQVAAAKITKLLLEYNLSEQDILDSEKIDNPIIIEKISYKNTLCAGNWYSYLINIICKYNMCKSLISCGLKNNRHFREFFDIIGRTSNIEIVKYLIDSLSVTFFKLATKQYKIDNLGLTRAVFLKSYLTGCALGLKAKYDTMLETSNMTSLVKIGDAEVQKYIDNNFGKIKPNKSKERREFGAEDLGYEAGKNVQLTKGINKKDGKYLR